MDETLWKVVTFETINGDKPVDEFIEKQQTKARAKILHAVRLLRQHGNRLTMPHSKMLESRIYELRIRGKEELRILYCFTPGKIIYLLHGFKKQTQKTPQKDIEIALKRLRLLT